MVAQEVVPPGRPKIIRPTVLIHQCRPQLDATCAKWNDQWYLLVIERVDEKTVRSTHRKVKGCPWCVRRFDELEAEGKTVFAYEWGEIESLDKHFMEKAK